MLANIMNAIVRGCFVVVIITLQYEFRNTSVLQASNETDAGNEDIPSLYRAQSTHSSPKATYLFETSSLNIESLDFNLRSIETPNLPKTESKVVTSSDNLFTSISPSDLLGYDDFAYVTYSPFLNLSSAFVTTETDMYTFSNPFASIREDVTDDEIFYSHKIKNISSEYSTTTVEVPFLTASRAFLSISHNLQQQSYNNVSNAISLISAKVSKNYTSSTANSSTIKQPISSTATIEGQSFTENIIPFENAKVVSLNDSLGDSKGENLKQSNVSHEIINGNYELKNKTSRNEDPQLDEIISGIVHLFAGNVQLARPVADVFASSPKRHNRPPFRSTRINNRGPLSSTTLHSRTVVVFSQPKNPTNAVTEVQFVPTGIVAGTSVFKLPHPSDKTMHVIRIQPTKVSERPASSISAIHFYNPGSNISTNKLNQPPFVGEIFTHNGAPPRPTIQHGNIPEGAILASFTQHSKPQNPKEHSLATYNHFIFSDPTNSVVGLPIKIHRLETLITTITEPNVADKISPTSTFEVFNDATKPQKTNKNSITTSMSFSAASKDTFQRDSIKPTKQRVPTADNQTVPFGPVTDWVPLIERPSMKFKPLSSIANITRTDNDVSIIVQPIIFDVTVNHSFNDLSIFSNKTIETSTSSAYNTTQTSTEFIDPVSKTKLESSMSEVVRTQNKNLPTLTPLLKESKLFSTPFNETKTSTLTLHGSHTELKEKPNFQKFSISTIAVSKLAPTAVQSVFLSSQVQEKDNLQETNSITLSSNPSTVSNVSEILPPTPSNIHPLLGRPTVIPVDIEEVRPYVGAINPINQDKPRGSYTPFRGSFPYPPGSVQVTKAGVDVREESTSLPSNPSSTSRIPIIRSQPRPRPNTIRIDTCIVGDDSTCDSQSNETCKTEHGISSCHCRPGYARSYTRGPCIPVVSLMVSLKVDRLGNKKISFSPKYLDRNSEEYRIMEFEAKQALTTLFTHSAFSRTFLGARVNPFYSIGGKVIINATVFLEEKESTRAQSIRLRLRQEIGESIRSRNRKIGESRLYVEGPLSPLTNIEDVNECSDSNLNDCADDGMCLNVFGTFLCKCKAGYIDPFKHSERSSGRNCLACQPDYCTYHGQCFVERDQKLCKCHGNYIGYRCEIDGEALGVALGVALAATIIIVLTVSCLCIWNRKWKKQQQKAEVLSSRSYNSNNTFSNMLNANVNPYNLTMEDRMRWVHISDVVKGASIPNSEHPYASSAFEQAAYPSRFQHPSDEEASWYDYRTRPRSRVMSHPRTSPNISHYEMESIAHGSYYGGHSSKRIPKNLTRY